MKKLIVAAAIALSSVACSKSDAPSNATTTPAAEPAKGGGPPAKSASEAKVITLKKFGLKASAPGETEDPIIGDGEPAMVIAAFFTVTVGVAKDTDSKTLKDAQEAAKMFKPTNIKTETLGDGWSLTYQNTGSGGDNYFVNVRREIGGKAYLCETMQSTAEQQKKALAFCKSLSKA